MAEIQVTSGWAGVSEVQQEGFKRARQNAGKDAQIYLCSIPSCTWWGWNPSPHYNPDGSGKKHDADVTFAPDRLGIDYVIRRASSS